MSCPRVLLFSSCVFLLVFHLSLSFASPSNSMAMPLGAIDYSGGNSSLHVLRGSPEYTSIALESPSIVMEEKSKDLETFQVFGLPGEPFIMEEGVPTVPQVSRFYRIPNTGGVDLVISNLDDFELRENINVMPYQEEGTEHFGLARSAVYDQDQWYPPVVAEMSSPMIMRDFRLVRVAIYPVQVNPVTHQERIYNNIGVEIVANDSPGENELTNPRQISGAWVPLYRNLIPNLDEGALDDASNTPGSILILTSNNASPHQWADSLAFWKRRKGYNVTVDARASWTSTTARSAILTAYQTWDPPLEYAILMGDPGANWGIPVTGGYGDSYDHEYASLT